MRQIKFRAQLPTDRKTFTSLGAVDVCVCECVGVFARGVCVFYGCCNLHMCKTRSKNTIFL